MKVQGYVARVYKLKVSFISNERAQSDYLWHSVLSRKFIESLTILDDEIKYTEIETPYRKKVRIELGRPCEIELTEWFARHHYKD